MSPLTIIDETTEAERRDETRDAANDRVSVRETLASARGPRFWRSLEELADGPAFRDMLEREFPRFAAEWTPDLDRRSFLKLSSASLALAGLAGCTRQPFEEIVPYVRQPEQVVPGKPLFFASGLSLGGYAVPVLAESHLGRPTKLDGNPEHPASMGKSDVFTQASVLDLYDPDRLQSVVNLGTIRTWKVFGEVLSNKLAALRALGGEGLRILTGTVTSPTQATMLSELLAEMPQAGWHQFDGLGRGGVYAGTERAFGASHEIRYNLANADVIVDVASDFLSSGPAAVRYAKDFAARRRVDSKDVISRLYTVESAPTSTGSSADHRLALKPSAVGGFVLALAHHWGLVPQAPSDFTSGDRQAFVSAVAADLEASRGRGLVVAGDHLDADVQVLVHAINDALGNAGATVEYTAPAAAGTGDQVTSLSSLVADMAAGKVDTLIIMGANPVYDAPADLDVAGALAKVPLSVSLTQRTDETAQYCQWQVPEAHALERWGDGRAVDGSIVITQPIIEPLYDGKSPIELVAIMLGKTTVPALELLRAQHADLDDKMWRRSVHNGFIADSALDAVAPALAPDAVVMAARSVASQAVAGGDLELSFRPDPTVLDGRFANNAWLQECPKPITKLTWDNALMVSPRTYRDLGLGEPFEYGDQMGQRPVVRLSVGERSIETPVWAIPGHADGAATLHLGYGRTSCGRVGEGAGVNANVVRSADGMWQVLSGVAVASTDKTELLASTQDHHSMEGRDLVKMADLETYRRDPEHAFHGAHHGLDTSKSMMDASAGWKYDGYAWGMTIDLNACSGCNACVVACQAENNIPTVGKDQVSRGREMHWIRVDRYFVGEDGDDVNAIVSQPVACVHCEQAPCEVVCPVAATVHSDEGLNDMVYNRCVGTRYCSNNCPYKVRRFNFLLYADFETPQLQLGRNPDVTVRSRGVMEKCSYCVQRINEGRIDAKREGRQIADGEVVTACQSACPSDAITFGDINDPDSAVSRAKASPRNYNLLDELGTRPRTSYLARVRNPNPALASVASAATAAPAEAEHGHEDAHG